MNIDCPSGLAGEIRGMKGKEAQAFVDPLLVRTNGSIDAVLQNCFLNITNPGPYKLNDKGRLVWKEVLVGDRFDALCEIRALTFGPDYEFNVKCNSCEKQYGWELSLKDLPRRKLPEASFEKLENGQNRFEHVLPDGKVLTFKLATGIEEALITKLKGGPGGTRKLGPIDAICVQAYQILEGEDAVQQPIPLKGGPTGLRKYLEELDYADVLEIIRAMQDVDCGVETEIETICEICGWQQEIELPFQRSFFDPRRKKKAATEDSEPLAAKA